MDRDLKFQLIEKVIGLIRELPCIVYMECEGGAHWKTVENLDKWDAKHPQLRDVFDKLCVVADEIEALDQGIDVKEERSK